MRVQNGFSGRRRLAAVIGALALVAGAAAPLEQAVAIDAIDWLDHSFGDGLQTSDLSPGGDRADHVAVQADGKVLVAATSGDSSTVSRQMVVFRFSADGRPDSEFGTEGKVLLERAGVERTLGLAIQEDGRILVAGAGATGTPGDPHAFVYVVRLDTTGKVDPTFSDSHADVTYRRSLHAAYTAFALAPDGKAVVAGHFWDPKAYNSTGMVMVRLNPDGSVDQGFGDGGFFLRPPPALTSWGETAVSVAVRSDGHIVVGGTVSYPSDLSGLPVSAWFLLTRVTPAGVLDPHFGNGGSVYTDVAGGSGKRSSGLGGMTFQPDGKIVAVGSVRREDAGFSGQAVARYLADGRLDPGFGSTGAVVTQNPPTSRNGAIAGGGTWAHAVAIDAKGRIVVGGTAMGFLTLDMALTRYTPTGIVDRSFGRSGWMKIERETDNDDLTALALQADGRIVVAGSLDRYKVLALGRIPAWDTSTTVVAWGWNGTGQLADDSTTQRSIAVPAPGSARTVTPAAGGAHSLSLRGDGVVLGAGWNGVGQLGDGSTRDRDTLAPIAGLDSVTAVAAGANHSLAVRGGRVYAWGWNATGQLGDGTIADRHTPGLVPGLTDVVEVAAGAYHSLARRSDGTIWAWGWNGVGQLGDGTTVDRRRPVQVPGMHSAETISAGALHSVAVASRTGTPGVVVWAWGWNGMGQSDPINAQTPVVPSPRLIMLFRPVAIAAGGYHNVMIGGNGHLYTWGWNALGQLGNGTTNPAVVVDVTAVPDAIAIAAGGAHTMATDSSGRTWTWGWNAMGQLGDGTTTDRARPTLVKGVGGAHSMSGGWYHSMGAVAAG